MLGSERSPMELFFEPQSVAVVGSLREGYFGGYVVIKTLLNAGFGAGAIGWHPVACHSDHPMPRLLSSLKAALCIAAASALTPALTLASSPECRSAVSSIPPTAPGAPGGRDFAARVAGLEGAARDGEVRAELIVIQWP